MHGAVLASDAGDGGHAPPAADFRGGNLQQVVVGIIFYADNDFPRAEAGDEIVGVWEIIVGKKPHEIVESIQICLAVQRRPAAVLAVKLSLILIEEHGIGIKIRHQGHIHVLSLYRGQGANKILPGPDRTDVDSELFQNIPAVKHH